MGRCLPSGKRSIRTLRWKSVENTGLSAARRLADLGIRDVVVLEREAEAGGGQAVQLAGVARGQLERFDLGQSGLADDALHGAVEAGGVGDGLADGALDVAQRRHVKVQLLLVLRAQLPYFNIQFDHPVFAKSASDIEIDFARGGRFPCPHCAKADCPVHDTAMQTWRHLDFFQHQAFLHARMPRITCGK